MSNEPRLLPTVTLPVDPARVIHLGAEPLVLGGGDARVVTLYAVIDRRVAAEITPFGFELPRRVTEVVAVVHNGSITIEARS